MSLDRQYKVDLVRDMADCDANFIRLLKLMPELESYRLECLKSLDNPGSEECGAGQTVNLTTAYALGKVGQCAREFSLFTSADEASHLHIRLRVVEIFRYTSTIVVEQLNTLHSLLPAPRVMVRLYHDANTAEAVEYHGHKALLAKYTIPNAKMFHRDEKRQINEFLGEWLSLCLSAGYSSRAPEFACTA